MSSPLVLLIPEEALPFILIAAALALLVGARKTAASLVGLALVMIVAPLLVEPLIGGLPDWALVLVIVGVVLMMIYSVVALLIGRKNIQLLVAHWKARVIARLVLGTILLPFRLIYVLGRQFYRSLRNAFTP